jgi:DNA polymerase-2
MKIEAHESVTAFGREVLLQAKEVAEQHGFRVLYYNVDGLYIQKQGCSQPEDFTQVLSDIRARTGLMISLDGIYRWIAFLPSRTNPQIPVANRYFGMFSDGKLKVRGLEIRRHDTPPFIFKTQIELLHCLAKVEEGQPLEHAVPAALRLLNKRAQQLRHGDVALDDLIVAQRLSRDVAQYRQPSPAAKAAKQLQALKKPMYAGQVVHFLFVKRTPGVLAWRAGAPFDYQQINIAEYLKLLSRAASNILSPVGVKENTLTNLLGIGEQLPLGFGDRTIFEQIDLPHVGINPTHFDRREYITLTSNKPHQVENILEDN